MKKLLNHNSYTAGVLICLAVEILVGALLWGALLLFGIVPFEHINWFAAMFILPILLVRYYAHDKSCPMTLKGLVVAFFLTFLVYTYLYIKYVGMK